MSWKTEQLGKSKNAGNVVARVRLFEDVTGEEETIDIPGNDLTDARVAEFCQRLVEVREARDAAFDQLMTAGPITLPREAKDQETKDKLAAIAAADAFFVLLEDYNALQAQAAKGIIAADDKSVTDAAAAMKTAFLPEYASDLRFR